MVRPILLLLQHAYLIQLRPLVPRRHHLPLPPGRDEAKPKRHASLLLSRARVRECKAAVVACSPCNLWVSPPFCFVIMTYLTFSLPSLSALASSSTGGMRYVDVDVTWYVALVVASSVSPSCCPLRTPLPHPLPVVVVPLANAFISSGYPRRTLSLSTWCRSSHLPPIWYVHSSQSLLTLPHRCLQVVLPLANVSLVQIVCD